MDTGRSPNSERDSRFHVRDLGLVDYAAAYREQLDLVAARKCGRLSDDCLVLVEHPEVYTYGRRSRAPHLPLETPAYSVERGGEVTYHNPGQLVGYPILLLGPGERDLHRYLRRLESALLGVLADFGISGERRQGATGVWIVGKEKKIASIGVAVSGWVTYHGCALNVTNDLSGFLKINPCGFRGEVMTSMKGELRSSCPSLEDVKASFVEHFCQQFQRVPAGSIDQVPSLPMASTGQAAMASSH